MPLISITRLRLRSVRFLPPFAIDVFRTRKQLRHASGFQSGSLLPDRDWTFWTMTAWNGEDSMRDYMRTGPHQTSMPHLMEWCDEASVVHWEQPQPTLPSWTEADTRMRHSGRASKLRHPSPRHATLAYRAPRTSTAGPIGPARAA